MMANRQGDQFSKSLNTSERLKSFGSFICVFSWLWPDAQLLILSQNVYNTRIRQKGRRLPTLYSSSEEKNKNKTKQNFIIIIFCFRIPVYACPFKETARINKPVENAFHLGAGTWFKGTGRKNDGDPS